MAREPIDLGDVALDTRLEIGHEVGPLVRTLQRLVGEEIGVVGSRGCACASLQAWNPREASNAAARTAGSTAWPPM